MKNVVSTTPLLSAKQEIELAHRIKLGDQRAYDLMILANQRIVVAIAMKYHSNRITTDDFISAGNVGLMKAARGFDPAVGSRFLTYASWWIHQKMRFLLSENRSVRIPRHLFDRLHKINWLARAMESAHGYPPTNQQIAEEIGVSERAIDMMMALNNEPVSMDMSIGTDDTMTIGDIIADPNQPDHIKSSDDREQLKRVAKVFKELDQREQEIITRRFGLHGKTPETLEEVATDWNLTRERVRQLQNIALEKLRFKLNYQDKLKLKQKKPKKNVYDTPRIVEAPKKRGRPSNMQLRMRQSASEASQDVVLASVR